MEAQLSCLGIMNSCAVVLLLYSYFLSNLSMQKQNKNIFVFFRITRNKVYKAQMTYAKYNNLVVQLWVCLNCYKHKVMQDIFFISLCLRGI